jgi:hypothetical protein
MVLIQISDDTLIHLINNTKLQKLILRGCGGIKGTTLNLLLENLLELQHLSLFGCTSIRDLTPAFERARAPLQYVELCSMYNVFDINLAIEALFRNCHATLKHLYLSHPELDPTVFDVIPEDSPMQLRDLHVTGLIAPTHVLKTLVKHVSDLETVSFSQSIGITESSLLNFFHATPKLTKIDLSFLMESVTDEVVEKISKVASSNLKMLRMCRGAHVTDKSLQYVSEGCPNLQELEVDFNDVTPAGIEALVMECKALTYLSASGCQHVMGSPLHDFARKVRAERLERWTADSVSRPAQLGPETIELQGLEEIDALRRKIQAEE